MHMHYFGLTSIQKKMLGNIWSLPQKKGGEKKKLYITTSSFALCSPEAKPVLEDELSEFSASLLAAYDSGEILSALEEGHTGWQKWVKNFGKSLKRKVVVNYIYRVIQLFSYNI